jgi:putative hemolysin
MLLALVVLLVLIEAVFTALEIAFGSISRSRLRSLADPDTPNQTVSPYIAQRAALALQVLSDAPRLTLTFIIVTSLSMWSAASLLTWISFWQNWEWWSLPLALTGVLFVAEVLPVLIAAPRAESMALRGVRIISLASTVLSPFIWIIGSIGYLPARLLGKHRQSAPNVTEDELRTALAVAEEEGAIESSERSLLEGAMDFRAKIVREVMTPRQEIVGIPADASIEEILHTAVSQGHSRLPVYEKSLDKILGVVATKDLLPYLNQGLDNRELRARDLVRPPFFVPASKRIAATLEELRQQRTLMAVVVADDGDIIGLVTLEDLLEEIVGDILDETDQEEPEMEILGQATLRVAAHVTVREVERFWEQEFAHPLTLRERSGGEANDATSLAALALQHFEQIPSTGDRITVGMHAGQSIEMEIVTMDGHRIEQVQLVPLTDETAGLPPSN